MASMRTLGLRLQKLSSKLALTPLLLSLCKAEDDKSFLILGGTTEDPYSRLNTVHKVTAEGVKSAGYTLSKQWQSCAARINDSHALLVSHIACIVREELVTTVLQ